MSKSWMLAGLLGLAVAACGGPGAGPETAPETSAPSAVEAPEGAQVITLSSGLSRATGAGAANAAGYLVITNPTGAADRLVSALSPRAERVELHEMRMDAGMMQMRQVEAIDIPAGGSITLEPGGLHLMFMGVTAPFVAGEAIPVTLTFETAGPIDTTLAVQPIDADIHVHEGGEMHTHESEGEHTHE